MPVYKKNGKYYARINYTTADGKYVPKQSKYFVLKRDAELEEAKLTAKYKAKDIDYTNKHYTFKEASDLLYEYKLNNNLSRGTLKRNKGYIKLFTKFHSLVLDRMTQADADSIKKHIVDNYKESSYKNYFGYVKQLLKFAKNNLHQNLNNFDFVCPKITQPTRRLNYYTEEEVAKFIEQLDDNTYITLFNLLFYNGLRISEARGLTFNDFDGKSIIIDKQFVKGELTKKLKTDNSYRTLPVNDLVANLINKQKEYYSSFYGFDYDWYIFGGLKPLGDTAITNHYEEARKKAKLKKITIHEFRHSCASHYIHKGYQINLIATLLGDNVLTVIKTYYHLYNQDLIDMIRGK